MKLVQALMLTAAVSICFSGTSISDEGKDESGKGKTKIKERNKEKHDRSYDKLEDQYDAHHGSVRDNSYFQEHGYTRLHIPKGHYPPPGECRIWYPERPAGHQPPPGRCGTLRAQVPPGAWLIQHPEDNIDVVYVHAYDERRPGFIKAVGEFNIGSGVFVRIVID